MKKLAKQNLRVLLIFLFTISQLPVFAGNSKLHIATNKENYTASETVQFQVFLLNPSEKVNNTLFVELLDCYGNKLSSQMLPFNFNISSGYISLPEAGKAAFYLLYCYVNNSDSMECSSIKKIFIGDPAQKKPGNKININYFFEGGSFVAESPNNILVRCTDENDNPVIAKGKVTNGKSSIYAVFETNELGFAKIILNPEDKVRYFVEAKDNNNREGISPIRMAASSGITLNTGISENSIFYNLLSYSTAAEQLPDYRIEALSNGEIIYDAALSFQNGLSAVKEEIKKELFPAGLISFRVVDKSNKIYAQRVLYNEVVPAQNNLITIIDTINKKEAKVILPGMISGRSYIHIKNTDPGIMEKNDLDFLAVTDRITINDQLIAAEDLPNSFNAPDNNTNRFLSITGILMNYEKKPVKNKNVNLVIQHKNLKKQYLVTKTDGNGKLQVDNLVFFDSVTVYYQLADKSEEKNDLYMDLKVSPAAGYTNGKTPPLNFICAVDLPATETNNIIKPEEKTLNQVVINTNAQKTESEKYADRYVSGEMKKTNALRNEIDLIKNPEVIDNRSIWTYIQSRIPSLRVFISPQGNPVLSASNGGTVGVYLNDMELPIDESLNFLNNLQVKDVAQVKYYGISFRPKMIGKNPLTDAKAADGGDLLIYTKRDYSPEEKTKGLPKTTVVGYTIEKPALTSERANNGSLFWKPDWNVESGQRIYIGLPASGTEKNTENIIEGINRNAAPYRFTQKLVFN
jgi:hypothetical protein